MSHLVKQNKGKGNKWNDKLKNGFHLTFSIYLISSTIYHQHLPVANNWNAEPVSSRHSMSRSPGETEAVKKQRRHIPQLQDQRKRSFSCKEKKDGYYRHPEHCNIFYQVRPEACGSINIQIQRKSAGEISTLDLKPMRKDTRSPKQEQSLAPQNGPWSKQKF